MKQHLLKLIVLISSLPLIATAQVPAGHLCKPHTGQVPEAYGPGDCDGNNFRSYDLSYVSEGLMLYYNSLLGEHNILGFGKRITSGDVSFVDLNASKPYFWAGDGTFIDLEYQTTGSFAGKYVAKDRSTLSGFFKEENASEVSYTSMDEGIVYTYQLLSGTKYKLISTVHSMQNPVTSLTSGRTTTITNNAEPKLSVKLIKDSLNRLVTIAYADGTKYTLRYWGTTSLLISEILTAPDGSSEKTSFIYDKVGRLLNLILTDHTSVRYFRNIREKYSEAYYPSGQGQRIDYDDNGHVKKIVTYLFGSGGTRTTLEEAKFEYDFNGMRLWTEYPAGPRTIRVTSQFTDQGVPSGHKKYENDQLIEEFSQVRNNYTLFPSMETLKKGDGKVLSQVQYAHDKKWPFSMTSMKVLEGPNKGRSEYYSQSGAKTTTAYFNRNITKERTRVSENGLLITDTDHLAPANQVSRYTYDAQNRLSSETINGKTTYYRYDKEDRVVYIKRDPQTTEYEYDEKGFITKVYDRYPGGVTTATYARTHYPGKTEKIKALLETIVHPSKKTEINETYYNEDGSVSKEVWNGEVVWEG